MIVMTADQLSRQSPRVDRRLRAIEKVLAAMRRGNALHHYYTIGVPVWVLSDGTRVGRDIAEAAIRNPSIVPVGEALFAGCRPQTYRYAQA
jgi:hypothetical protein